MREPAESAGQPAMGSSRDHPGTGARNANLSASASSLNDGVQIEVAKESAMSYHNLY